MNDVKLLLKLEHISEGNKWREFAEIAGVNSFNLIKATGV